MIHYKLYQINNNIYKKINVHIFIFNKYIYYIKQKNLLKNYVFI